MPLLPLRLLDAAGEEEYAIFEIDLIPLVRLESLTCADGRETVRQHLQEASGE
jgi:hypothetical protein